MTDLLADLIGTFDYTPANRANPANQAPAAEAERAPQEPCEGLLTVANPANGCERPYALTNEQGDRAHAKPWGDATIARFQARAGRLAALGFGGADAEDIAEALVLRDAERDDRAACVECRSLAGFRGSGFRCGRPAAAGLHGREVGEAFAVKLQRCGAFERWGDDR